MDWLYGGYLASWYAALSVVFVLALPSHTEPWLLALACFVLIPSLIVGCSSLLEGFLPRRDGAAVDRGIESGRLSRRRVFAVGALAALASMGLLGTIFLSMRSLWTSFESIWILFVVGSAILASAIPLAAWWLSRKLNAAETAIRGSD